MEILPPGDGKNPPKGTLHKKRIQGIQDMEITFQKFFVISQSRWSVEMQPQKFPFLIFQAFIVVVLHAVNIGGGSGSEVPGFSL